MDKVMSMPGMQRPWMAAIESMVQARQMVERVTKSMEGVSIHIRSRLNALFVLDRRLLQDSIPFSWDENAIAAVNEVANTVPGDTTLTRWNLPIATVWWHMRHSNLRTEEGPIESLNIGWIGSQFVIGVWVSPETPEDIKLQNGMATPSQLWSWQSGETIDQMIVRIEQEHKEAYGPGGRFSDMPQTSLPKLMQTSRQIAQFIVAALAWMEQKILVENSGHVERHRRKDIQRRTGKNYSTVQIIQLRRTERKEADGTESTDRHITVRFLVNGHWRQQPCGPQRSERRLTYILPFVKGPDDAPFQSPRQRVFEVNR